MSENDPKPIIRINGLSKHFGAVAAVDDVSLDIMAGEFFALLGPSGCGKSTLLRMLAGLESPSAGAILIDGEDMSRVPANRRPVNMVFQSYAVFPHMSVLDNVGYGLKVTGVPAAEVRARATEALELVKLDDLGARMPDQLSGGQRQRVALARALVKRPKVLLLDEPLSALDAKLREAMRLELVNLQETVGITFIIVTHDQEEALAMADRIAVMDQGVVRQVAPPAELYEFPASRFVADFIGSVNIFEGRVSEARDGVITIDAPALPRPLVVEQDKQVATGAKAWVAVRPEKIDIVKAGAGPLTETQEEAVNTVPGVVEEITYLGDLSIYHVRIAEGAEGLVKIAEPNFDRATNRPFTWEDAVMLSWTADAGVVLDS
ncbi:MAG: ABC transporter ATP-binding protein [Alphaproteobacteria bacterium]|jgi:spermidine/putrescine ABC transporter ATP-binding subunit|nr:ABC transporter ATP-binding protein [Alphaproteobacteria bacterium]